MIPLYFPKIGGEPMGAPAIFEKQIEIKLLHSGVTDSGSNLHRLKLFKNCSTLSTWNTWRSTLYKIVM
ncbi:MAG: hypothetical protein P8X74_05585 [Reinekea sp.]